jgi:hypothetical protein
MRGSKPGERRGGRRKGTPNKVTADLKEAVLNAFNKAGGSAYLEKVARKHPAVFCALLGKILPRDIKAEHSGGITLSQLIEESCRQRDRS